MYLYNKDKRGGNNKMPQANQVNINPLEIYDLTIILGYIFHFFLVFIIAFVGALAKDIHDKKRDDRNRIQILRVLTSTIFISIILTTINSYFIMNFPLLILITFIAGIWSYKALELVFNIKLFTIIIKHIFSELKNPIAKGASAAIQEIQDMQEDEIYNSINNKSKEDLQTDKKIEIDKEKTKDSDKPKNTNISLE